MKQEKKGQQPRTRLGGCVESHCCMKHGCGLVNAVTWSAYMCMGQPVQDSRRQRQDTEGKPALEAGNRKYSCSCIGAEEADDSEDEKAAAKTRKETQWDWELLNDNKALWLRSAKDVDEEEYDKFYQTLSKVCPSSPVHSRL